MPRKYIKVAVRKRPGPKPGFIYHFGNKSDEEIAAMLTEQMSNWGKRIAAGDFEYRIGLDLKLKRD